jgi:hypothetical protein
MTSLVAYIGRDNEERLELLNNGSVVTAGAVTRAVFKFSAWCLDTEIDSEVFYFLNPANQTLCFKLGLVEGIRVGTFTTGRLTIYDHQNQNGIAWGPRMTVIINAWPVCSA